MVGKKVHVLQLNISKKQQRVMSLNFTLQNNGVYNYKANQNYYKATYPKDQKVHEEFVQRIFYYFGYIFEIIVVLINPALEV